MFIFHFLCFVLLKVFYISFVLLKIGMSNNVNKPAFYIVYCDLSFHKSFSVNKQKLNTSKTEVHIFRLPLSK